MIRSVKRTCGYESRFIVKKGLRQMLPGNHLPQCNNDISYNNKKPEPGSAFFHSEVSTKDAYNDKQHRFFGNQYGMHNRNRFYKRPIVAEKRIACPS